MGAVVTVSEAHVPIIRRLSKVAVDDPLLPSFRFSNYRRRTRYSDLGRYKTIIAAEQSAEAPIAAEAGIRVDETQEGEPSVYRTVDDENDVEGRVIGGANVAAVTAAAGPATAELAPVERAHDNKNISVETEAGTQRTISVGDEDENSDVRGDSRGSDGRRGESDGSCHSGSSVEVSGEGLVQGGEAAKTREEGPREGRRVRWKRRLRRLFRRDGPSRSDDPPSAALEAINGQEHDRRKQNAMGHERTKTSATSGAAD